MTSESVCELCRNRTQLKDSHVIPKFVFKWLKETSGTDYLRFGASPNRRVQDGLKHKMLCYECEQRLSVYEKRFSEEVFSPITKGLYPRGHYEAWLSKFAASLVWRVIASQKLRGIYRDSDSKLMEKIDHAFEHWRKFLLGVEKSPGIFEIHMIPIGEMSDIKIKNLPTNWNRYTLRGVEIDLATTGSLKFVSSYVKIGPIAFFGHINNERQPWKGSRLSVSLGNFHTPRLILPPMLIDFFVDRAKSGELIMSGISRKQRKVTEGEVNKNLERLAQSDQFKAMILDAERFGVEAITYRDED